MSLAQIGIVLSAAMALRGRTWAGENVLAFPEDIADEIASATAPVIAVNPGEIVIDAEGSDPVAGDARASFVVQVFLPPVLMLGSREVASTGAGRLLAFGVVARQIESSLLDPREDAPWAALWRAFAFRVVSTAQSPHLLETQAGARLSAIEIEFICDCLCSPPLGEEPSGPWADLIAAMEASGPDLAAAAPIVDAAIRTPGALPGWARAAAALGLSRGSVAGIGLAPHDATEQGDAAEAARIVIDGLGPADVMIEAE